MPTRNGRPGDPSATEEEIVYDPTLGRNAFEELAPLREALGPTVPPAPRLDMQRVAVLVIAIALRIAAARERFRNVEAELPAETVDSLRPAGWALWFASIEREKARAKETHAMVPAELIDEGMGLKNRMMKVADYHLADDEPDVSATLAKIRSGTGHIDLASDLNQLADIYDDYEPELRDDKKRYSPADATAARRVAGLIVTHLGRTDDAKWTDAINRSWALIDRLYFDIRPFALALFRYDSPERQYPSLFTARARRTSKPKAEATNTDDLLGGGGGAQP